MIQSPLIRHLLQFAMRFGQRHKAKSYQVEYIISGPNVISPQKCGENNEKKNLAFLFFRIPIVYYSMANLVFLDMVTFKGLNVVFVERVASMARQNDS